LNHLRPILENLVPTGSKYKEINAQQIANFEIPLPPMAIQKNIVKECEAVEQQAESALSDIENSRAEIEQLTAENAQKKSLSKKLGSGDVAKINPSKTEIKNVDNDTLVSFVEMASVSDGGYIADSVDRPLGDLRKSSYTYFAENDIIIAKITPCMENGKCALAKGLTNGLGMGSSEFHVIRAKTANFLPEYLFALLNRKSVRLAAEKVMTGASGHRRVPASFYENFAVPALSLKEQQKFVAKVEALEKQITDAQAVIDAAPARKEAVMKKYL
jgi:restriction endonuclease S subunit